MSVLPANEKTVRYLAEKVTPEIIELWRKMNPRVITSTEYSVAKRLEREFRQVRDVVRSATPKEREKLDAKLDRLLDICACRCPMLACEEAGCDGCEKVHMNCSCPRQFRIPEKELVFMKDQRQKIGTKGMMQMSIVDQAEKLRQQKAAKRQRSENKNDDHDREQAEGQVSSEQRASSTERGTDAMNDDSDWTDSGATGPSAATTATTAAPPPPPSAAATAAAERTDQSQLKQNRQRLSHVAMEADRWSVSDRAAAAIATATLVDFGLVTQFDRTLIIDRHKIRRERENFRERERKESKEQWKNEPVFGVYFDGKSDETMQAQGEGSSKRVTVAVEDHVVLVSEPGSSYLGHVTPSGKDAESITDAIMNLMEEERLTSNWQVIGADSTSVNTGCHRGVIARIEQRLGHKLHWAICLLHLNELPLRHVFQDLDGPTSGSRCFQGPVGKSAITAEFLPLDKSFKRIQKGPGPPDLPEKVVGDLSSDQRYLHRMMTAVRSGDVPEDLVKAKPGPVNHARWLTLACRILRLYVSKHGLVGDARRNLNLLALFVMVSYGPMWFDIKCHPTISDGPRLFLRQLELLRLLPAKVRSTASTCVARNSYTCHPENLLLSMLTDDKPEVREAAVKTVLSIRRNGGDEKAPRPFLPPDVNLRATSLQDLIMWDKVKLHEPLITCDATDAELMEVKDVPYGVPSYPNHNQAVERCVKLVTIASKAVCGPERRDGYIRAQMKSRGAMPTWETKKDYGTP